MVPWGTQIFRSWAGEKLSKRLRVTNEVGGKPEQGATEEQRGKKESQEKRGVGLHWTFVRNPALSASGPTELPLFQNLHPCPLCSRLLNFLFLCVTSQAVLSLPLASPMLQPPHETFVSPLQLLLLFQVSTQTLLLQMWLWGPYPMPPKNPTLLLLNLSGLP